MSEPSDWEDFRTTIRLTREMAEQRLMALARQASRQESQYAQELVRSIDSINAVASSPAIR